MVLGKNSNSKTHSFVIYYDELWFKEKSAQLFNKGWLLTLFMIAVSKLSKNQMGTQKCCWVVGWCALIVCICIVLQINARGGSFGN